MIETRVPGGHASPFGRLLDTAHNIEYAAETTDQSSLNLIYLLAYQPAPKGFPAFGVSDERYHIRGGNQRLPEAIADKISPIQHDHRLTAISQAGGTVTLSFQTASGPKVVKPDRAILTVSFAALRTLDYKNAGFDDRKRTAIEQLGAGRNSKLQLQFNSRLWTMRGSNGSSYTDLGHQNTWEVSRGFAIE